MPYRCTVNQSGYCQDTDGRRPAPVDPTFTTAGGVKVLDPHHSVRCTLDPQNCGFFISWKEECRRAQGPATPRHNSLPF